MVGASNGSNGSAANKPPPAWPGRVVVPEVTKSEGVKVSIAVLSTLTEQLSEVQQATLLSLVLMLLVCAGAEILPVGLNRCVFPAQYHQQTFADLLQCLLGYMVYFDKPAPPFKAEQIVWSAGSIGTQTLDIVKEHGDRFEVVALAAGGNVALLAEQVQLTGPLVQVTTSSTGRDGCFFCDSDS